MRARAAERGRVTARRRERVRERARARKKKKERGQAHLKRRAARRVSELSSAAYSQNQSSFIPQGVTYRRLDCSTST